MLGDEFGFNSFNKYYVLHQTDEEEYMKNAFEIGGFMNNKSKSYDVNVLSRFRNNLIGVISDQLILPKIIVIVPDNDLIRYFWYKDTKDVVCRYSRMLKWLMCQYNRSVSSQKEYLPEKSQKDDWPFFLWIIPPLHSRIRSKENELREQFVMALTNVASLHENTYVLELKKKWDPEDHNLYNRTECTFTAEGLIAYWNAVDKTVKYFNTLVLKKRERKKLTATDKTSSQKEDKYHWSKQSSKQSSKRY